MGRRELAGEISGGQLANQNIIMSGHNITGIHGLWEPIELHVPKASDVPRASAAAVTSGRLVARDELFAPIEVRPSDDELQAADDELQAAVATELATMVTEVDGETETGKPIKVYGMEEIREGEPELISKWLAHKSERVVKALRRLRSKSFAWANRDEATTTDDSDQPNKPEPNNWPEMPRRTTAKERQAAVQALQHDRRRRRSQRSKRWPQSPEPEAALA